MSKSVFLPASILVLAVAVFFHDGGSGASVAQDSGKSAGAAWEYKIVRATEDELNRHGREGWEVVAAYGDVKGQSAGMRAINTIERAVLKRRVGG